LNKIKDSKGEIIKIQKNNPEKIDIKKAGSTGFSLSKYYIIN
tara:strand:- start:443046 stop:443171 length:126 start_codon:yes stop_codon:yes gene_type:complete